MTETNSSLIALEEFLRETLRANYYLTSLDLVPRNIINQIVTQLKDNHFNWVDNTIYVPNLLTVLVPGATPDKLEEVEVVFNSVVFMKYLYEYMTELDYKLFDFVKVEVEAVPITAVPYISLKFHWPSPDEVREDFTVLLDKQQGKIVEVFPPRADIPQLARLRTLNGETYRPDYVVTKKLTYLGRLKNIIDRETGYMLRRNDFIFARHPDPQSANSSVSRLHAKIVFNDGNFILYDTGSANGTSIMRNDTTLELPRAESSGEILQDGDVLLLGSAQVQFQLISDQEATALAALPTFSVVHEEGGGDDTTYLIKRTQIDTEMKKIRES